MLSVGIKENDATISLDNLFAANRKVLEPRANRFMFVEAPPVKVNIATSAPLKAHIQYHPSHPERGGSRTVEVTPINGFATVYISRGGMPSIFRMDPL